MMTFMIIGSYKTVGTSQFLPLRCLWTFIKIFVHSLIQV